MSTKGWVTIWVGVFAVVLGFIAFLMIVLPVYNRYQARANAHNKVQVTAIEIQNQAQQVQVARQQAQIRLQEAIGLRKAQDEVRKTLTPLYVEFELVQALQAIATSGSNDTVIYLPTDPKSGLPVVPTSNSTTGH